jgi:hypothetical protein
VNLTYLRILLTETQWMLVGAWRNWQTLLTAKARSGCVKVRYCRASTMLLYLVLSLTPRAPLQTVTISL